MKKSLLYGSFFGTTTASSVLIYFQTFGFSYEFFIIFLYGYAGLGLFIAYFTHRRVEVLKELGSEAEAGLYIVWKDLIGLIRKKFSFKRRRRHSFVVNGREYRGNLNKIANSNAFFTDVKDCESEKTQR